MTRFPDKVKAILQSRNIKLIDFGFDTGIHRRFFGNTSNEHHRPRKATIMAIAYYLGMTAEDLVEGTDAEDIWYG